MAQHSDLPLTFEAITEEDLPRITPVMTRAFDDDSQRHLGQERGGPEGYDNGDFFRTWLFGYQESEGYKVMTGETVIGATIVWILPDRHNIVGTIFVDPAYQNRGVGRRLWQFIEQRYPETKSWRLETPAWAIKNHAFYQNTCGFQQVASDPILTPSDDAYLYRKVMRNDADVPNTPAVSPSCVSS